VTTAWRRACACSARALLDRPHAGAMQACAVRARGERHHRGPGRALHAPRSARSRPRLLLIRAVVHGSLGAVRPAMSAGPAAAQAGARHGGVREQGRDAQRRARSLRPGAGRLSQAGRPCCRRRTEDARHSHRLAGWHEYCRLLSIPGLQRTLFKALHFPHSHEQTLICSLGTVDILPKQRAQPINQFSPHSSSLMRTALRRSCERPSRSWARPRWPHGAARPRPRTPAPRPRRPRPLRRWRRPGAS